MVTWTRRAGAAALPVAAVAIIAGIVSYSHIEHLALAEHQPLTLARLFPFAVDGLIAAGSVVVLGGEQLGWLAVVPGVAATLFANIESGIGYGPLAATVAAWPAVAFSVASFVLERWIKRLAGQPPASTGVPAAPPFPAAAPPPVPADVPGVPVPAPGVPGVLEPVPAGHGLNGHGHEAERLYAAELAAGDVPPIRRIRAEMHVGGPRAKEIQAHLERLTPAGRSIAQMREEIRCGPAAEGDQP